MFGVGCLKVAHDSGLLRELREIKWRLDVHHELQWKRLDHADYGASAVRASEEVMTCCATAGNAEFVAIFEDGRESHLVNRYGDKWSAYEALAADAISRLIDGDEIVCVIADRYTPPKYLGFEHTVRHAINTKLGRLAVASIVRVKSSSTDALQAVDLLLGAIAFDFRYPGETSNEKGRLAAMVRAVHDVPSYRPRGRSARGWYDIQTRIPRRGKRGRRASSPPGG